MSGHNKWSQIQRQKGITDGAKSRTFARFAKLITIESKKAGGNVTAPGVAAAISRARAINMPKENIERAVAKGLSKDGGELERVTYEFYGPGGIAVIVDALTDNKNRTTQEIKHLLTKNELELGAPGSALWAFAKSPAGIFSPNEPLMDIEGDSEASLLKILELMDEHEDVQQIYTNARGYETMRDD